MDKSQFVLESISKSSLFFRKKNRSSVLANEERQPHLSISWNFPPPLFPLIYSISFELTHTANFTMEFWKNDCKSWPQWERHWYRGQPYPSQITLTATALAFQGSPLLSYQTLASPEIPFHFWQPIWWLQDTSGICVFSEEAKRGLYSQRDQSFCRQLGRGQVSLIQVNLERA